jgi:membrane fusion protein, multidrug efflux system
MSTHTFNRHRWLAVGATTLTLAAIAAATAIALRATPAAANAAPAAPAAVPVSVAEVVAQTVDTWTEHSGRFEAVNQVELRARVAGTVQAVHFREGALVKAGALLFTIDPAPYAAEVERYEAQVAAARSRVTYTASEAQRAQRSWDERAIAERELDERSNAAQEAQAQLQSAQAALRSARLNLSYTQVRAPIAGRVGRLELTPGNLVSAGAAAPVLATLVSVNPIYASFDADEARVAGVLADLAGPGGAATARLERVPVQADTAGRTLQGRLQLVDNQVNTQSGTVRLRAVFDNADGALMPGQFAKLRLGQTVAKPALLVNERAVGTDQSKRFVMVVGADQTTAYREVTLGMPVNGLRVVTAGLKPGEQIVVNGLQRVRPGVQVAPTVVANPRCSRAPTEPTRPTPPNPDPPQTAKEPS